MLAFSVPYPNVASGYLPHRPQLSSWDRYQAALSEAEIAKAQYLREAQAEQAYALRRRLGRSYYEDEEPFYGDFYSRRELYPEYASTANPVFFGHPAAQSQGYHHGRPFRQHYALPRHYRAENSFNISETDTGDVERQLALEFIRDSNQFRTRQGFPRRVPRSSPVNPLQLLQASSPYEPKVDRPCQLPVATCSSNTDKEPFFRLFTGNQHSLNSSSPEAPRISQNAHAGPSVKPTCISTAPQFQQNPPSNEPSEIEIEKFLSFLGALGDHMFKQERQYEKPAGSTEHASSSKNVEAPSPAPAAKSTPTEAYSQVPVQISAQSIKHELESRLNNEYETEIRDTIQALLESLNDANGTLTKPSRPSQASNSTPSGPHVAASGSDKGKTRETAGAEQDTSTNEPSSLDILRSMESVRNVVASFHTLASDFEFPTTLDFTASTPTRPSSPASGYSSASSETSPNLAYSSRNSPMRYYTHALNTLLGQLDAIESFGHEDVRNARKEAVSTVEHALEELEKEVDARWRAWEARRRVQDVTSQDKPTAENELSVKVPTTGTETIEVPVAQGTSGSSQTFVTQESTEPDTIEPTVNLTHANNQETPGTALPEQSAFTPVVEPVSTEVPSSSLPDELSYSIPDEPSLLESTHAKEDAGVKEDSPIKGDTEVAPISSESALSPGSISPSFSEASTPTSGPTSTTDEKIQEGATVNDKPISELSESLTTVTPANDDEPTPADEEGSFLSTAFPDPAPALKQKSSTDDELELVEEVASDWSEVEA